MIINTSTISTDLIGPPDLSTCGIKTVIVFADALKLIWCNKVVEESNDGAKKDSS